MYPRVRNKIFQVKKDKTIGLPSNFGPNQKWWLNMSMEYNKLPDVFFFSLQGTKGARCQFSFSTPRDLE